LGASHAPAALANTALARRRRDRSVALVIASGAEPALAEIEEAAAGEDVDRAFADKHAARG
jgi:hypothetical protein